MVQPVKRQYQIRRGDVWSGEEFRLISASGAGFWSGATVKAQMRRTVDAPVTYEFVVTPVVTTEGTNGVLTFTLSIPATAAEGLNVGTYEGDVEVTSSGLPKSTVITFSATVVPDITRNTP
jgi:hypothetical protein